MCNYVIKSGDNLTNIAKNLGVTVKQLQDLNGIKDANKIIVGQTLKLPEGAGITMERTESKPEDEQIRFARSEAHQQEINRMNELKGKSKDIAKVDLDASKLTEKLLNGEITQEQWKAGMLEIKKQDELAMAEVDKKVKPQGAKAGDIDTEKLFNDLMSGKITHKEYTDILASSVQAEDEE